MPTLFRFRLKNWTICSYLPFNNREGRRAFAKYSFLVFSSVPNTILQRTLKGHGNNLQNGENIVTVKPARINYFRATLEQIGQDQNLLILFTTSFVPATVCAMSKSVNNYIPSGRSCARGKEIQWQSHFHWKNKKIKIWKGVLNPFYETVRTQLWKTTI